ncbi:MAG TPA: disulfide bond formation protein B [Candidatus Limnocylindria bacterium]|jgi:disulfide bond formation protein DsbB
MSLDLIAVANFLAILVLIAGIGSLAVLGLRLAAAVSEGAQGALDQLRDLVGPYALWLAWLIAATAMAGSLYFSEVAHLVPCALCWYQRIAMYPLAFILLVAAVRGDLGVRPYATVLAAVGAVVAAYHVLLQRFPNLPSGSCSFEVPCSAIDLERFGFITIPVMALVGFVSILTLLWIIAEPRTAPVEPEGAPEA